MLNDVLKLELEEEKRKLEEIKDTSADSVFEDAEPTPSSVSSDLLHWLEDCLDADSINEVWSLKFHWPTCGILLAMIFKCCQVVEQDVTLEDLKFNITRKDLDDLKLK